MNPDVKKVVLRNGLVGSTILLLFVVLSYFFNQDLLANLGIGLGIFLLCFAFGVVSVIQVKIKNKGVISFRDSFSAFILTAGFTFTFFTLVNIVLYNIVDVELGHYLNDQVITMLKENLIESGRFTEEQIDEQIKITTSSYMYSTVSLLKGLLPFVLYASVIGLLLAAVTKKNPSASNILDDE